MVHRREQVGMVIAEMEEGPKQQSAGHTHNKDSCLHLVLPHLSPDLYRIQNIQVYRSLSLNNKLFLSSEKLTQKIFNLLKIHMT